MVEDTALRVLILVKELYQQNHNDDMTKKWLCLTPNPPCVPVSYKLTKIHKPTPIGRPIISGCDGPTERPSSFVDRLLQPLAQKQKLYLKDTTDFINFIETTRVPKNEILVSMDVSSLHTKIPQEEGVETVCKTHNSCYRDSPPIPTQYLRRALKLILQENSFEFNGKKLPPNTWSCQGHRYGSSLCKYLYGGGRNRDS